MAITTTFDIGYPDNPWANLPSKEREFYDPLLREIYSRQSIYSRHIDFQFDLGATRTTKMHSFELIAPDANYGTLGNRDLWLRSNRFDTYEREITVSHYGDKLSFHKYDDMTTWLQQGNPGLLNIINIAMGQMVIDTMDVVARNAFMTHPYPYIVGGGSNFSAVGSSDKMTTSAVEDVWTGMQYRQLPYMSRHVDMSPGSLMCITTPGVIRDLREEAETNGIDWKTIVQYSDPNLAFNGAIGMYKNILWVSTPEARLMNAGTITVQATIDAAASQGDGAPAPGSTKVDGVYKMGQASGVTHSITVSDTTGFTVGDEVTIHKLRTSANGVTNGVDYTDPDLQVRRIVSISGTTGGTLVFNKPLMKDFDTDLGSGVYGYITLGQHIHTSLFIGARNGLMGGVGQPPRIHRPPVIDDTMSQNRVTWDGYFGYELWEPEAFELVLSSGTNRGWGAAY